MVESVPLSMGGLGGCQIGNGAERWGRNCWRNRWEGVARGVHGASVLMRRVSIYLLVAICLGVGAAAAVDAAVVTDQERMDEFIDSVTGQVSDSRIDGALRYADPSKMPVDLVRDGRARRYNDHNASNLRPDAREALATLEGSKLHLIQRSVALDGERARVALRLRTDAGLANTIFDLRREDDRWLLHRVTVN